MSLHLGWRGVEQIEDVAALAVTELDAERVHQNQSRQSMTARRRDLCGEPPAEGKSEQGHLFVGQRLEQVEIKTHQIVYGVEVSGPRRVAESRMRRRDDLGVRGKQTDERRLRVHRVQAMQQQDRRTCALAQDLEVDAAYRKPL